MGPVFQALSDAGLLAELIDSLAGDLFYDIAQTAYSFRQCPEIIHVDLIAV